MILGTATLLLIVADLALIALPRSTASPDIYGLRGIGAVFGIVLTGLGGAIALELGKRAIVSVDVGARATNTWAATAGCCCCSLIRASASAT